MRDDLTPWECVRIYGKHRFVEYGPIYNDIYAKLIGHNMILLECCRCEYIREKWIALSHI